MFVTQNLFNIGASDFLVLSTDEGLSIGLTNEPPITHGPSPKTKIFLMNYGALALYVRAGVIYATAMLYLDFGCFTG